ncbi:MAG: ATP-binding protein [Bdellovibrionaceae bacterium]|nr:ATP-binding protein [Pseudobdellovibrionaceae bacterium]
MASADQIKALIRSHAERDDSRFYSVAMQMAAQAARQGHSKLAEDLRSIIDEAKEETGRENTRSNTLSITQPRGELAGLLSVAHPQEQLSSVILPEETQVRLCRVVLEQRQKLKLERFGLTPRRKILLHGPPGTGKTLTASALAGELHLPLYTILLDGLITKYMGETASKLRLIFENIARVRGVYFFDEFDAIGSHRTSTNDVGEIRRVLNSFLQFLEQSSSDSLIVAATNNAQLLDKALFRRFDDVIEYQLPKHDSAIEIFKSKFSMFDTTNVNYETLASSISGLSFADLVRACEDAIKLVVLDDELVSLNTDLVVKCLEERATSRR